MKDKSAASSFAEAMVGTSAPINARQIIALPLFIANVSVISGENTALMRIIVTSATEANRALVCENDDCSDLGEVAQRVSG